MFIWVNGMILKILKMLLKNINKIFSFLRTMLAKKVYFKKFRPKNKNIFFFSHGSIYMPKCAE